MAGKREIDDITATVVIDPGASIKNLKKLNDQLKENEQSAMDMIKAMQDAVKTADLAYSRFVTTLALRAPRRKVKDPETGQTTTIEGELLGYQRISVDPGKARRQAEIKNRQQANYQARVDNTIVELEKLGTTEALRAVTRLSRESDFTDTGAQQSALHRARFVKRGQTLRGQAEKLLFARSEYARSVSGRISGLGASYREAFEANVAEPISSAQIELEQGNYAKAIATLSRTEQQYNRTKKDLDSVIKETVKAENEALKEKKKKVEAEKRDRTAEEKAKKKAEDSASQREENEARRRYSRQQRIAEDDYRKQQQRAQREEQRVESRIKKRREDILFDQQWRDYRERDKEARRAKKLAEADAQRTTTDTYIGRGGVVAAAHAVGRGVYGAAEGLISGSQLAIGTGVIDILRGAASGYAKMEAARYISDRRRKLRRKGGGTGSAPPMEDIAEVLRTAGMAPPDDTGGGAAGGGGPPPPPPPGGVGGGGGTPHGTPPHPNSPRWTYQVFRKGLPYSVPRLPYRPPMLGYNAPHTYMNIPPSAPPPPPSDMSSGMGWESFDYSRRRFGGPRGGGGGMYGSRVAMLDTISDIYTRPEMEMYYEPSYAEQVAAATSNRERRRLAQMRARQANPLPAHVRAMAFRPAPMPVIVNATGAGGGPPIGLPPPAGGGVYPIAPYGGGGGGGAMVPMVLGPGGTYVAGGPPMQPPPPPTGGGLGGFFGGMMRGGLGGMLLGGLISGVLGLIKSAAQHGFKITEEATDRAANMNQALGRVLLGSPIIANERAGLNLPTSRVGPGLPGVVVPVPLPVSSAMHDEMTFKDMRQRLSNELSQSGMAMTGSEITAALSSLAGAGTRITGNASGIADIIKTSRRKNVGMDVVSKLVGAQGRRTFTTGAGINKELQALIAVANAANLVGPGAGEFVSTMTDLALGANKAGLGFNMSAEREFARSLTGSDISGAGLSKMTTGFTSARAGAMGDITAGFSDLAKGLAIVQASKGAKSIGDLRKNLSGMTSADQATFLSGLPPELQEGVASAFGLTPGDIEAYKARGTKEGEGTFFDRIMKSEKFNMNKASFALNEAEAARDARRIQYEEDSEQRKAADELIEVMDDLTVAFSDMLKRLSPWYLPRM